MSHVPNISFREAIGLGGVGTLGKGDFASPDSTILPPRTRGALDWCSVNDTTGRARGADRRPSDAAWQALLDTLSRGPSRLAEQAYRLPTPVGTPGKITQQDFVDAAATLQCEVAAVKAVAEVESQGSGFLGDGRPKILFEAHKFSGYTMHLYDSLYPHISSPKRKQSLYRGKSKEYDRLHDAMRLDARAAIMSASWGAFQIMGFNHAVVGFATPEEFVAAMYTSEGEHLKAFIAYIRSRKHERYIRDKNWEAFAKAYNGPDYKTHNYDGRLAKAYAKHAGSATSGPTTTR